MKRSAQNAWLVLAVAAFLGGCGAEPEAQGETMTQQEMANQGISEGSAADSNSATAPSFSPDPQNAASDL